MGIHCSIHRAAVRGLLDKKHLAGVDFASGGQLVDPQKLRQRHFMALGDLKGAVSSFNQIRFQAFSRDGLGFGAGDFKPLPDMEPGGGQPVKCLNFFCSGTVALGQDPKGIPAPDDVFGRRLQWCGRCFFPLIGNSSPLRDPERLAGHDKMPSVDVVGAGDARHAGVVLHCNAGEGFTRSDPVPDIGRFRA